MNKFEFPAQGARVVWIASYPRSGNTFLRILLEKAFRLPSFSAYYVAGANHPDPSAEALEDAPLLPRDWRERLGDSESLPLVMIKTHDLPPDNAPAIFIARDGRAAIDSYYYYHKKFAFEQPSLVEVIAGACQFGSWNDHYWAWRPKTRPNTLLVLYDELVASPEAVVSRLAEFLKQTPEQTSLPPFQELQKRLPVFFRRGQNADFLDQWSPGHMALFNQLHASAMTDLGFSLAPSSEPGAEIVRELAQAAARLHRSYLEQLTNIGLYRVDHKQELQRLRNGIDQLSGYLDRSADAVAQSLWVRLGTALGAMKPLPEPPKVSVEPKGTATKQGADAALFKSSDENTRSSSLSLSPAPLSAPNADVSGRA